MFEVKFSNKAKAFLRKVPKEDVGIIVNKINSIRDNPYPHLKKLKGQKFWRLRVLKYRAIIDVLVSGKKLIVMRIGHRKKVYD